MVAGSLLQSLSASEARRALEEEVRSRGRALLVATLADVARQQIIGTTRDRSGVTRRRVLFHMSDFRQTSEKLVEDPPSLTSINILDQLVQISDVIQDNDTLFPAPLRLVETPAKKAFLLIGTASSSSFPDTIRGGLRAAGVGRIVDASAVALLDAPRISVDSWLGTPIAEDAMQWLALMEPELHQRAEYLVLEPEGVEVLIRFRDSWKCAWRSLADVSENRESAVLSQRGSSLVRLVNGSRVLSYLAVVGLPAAILQGRTRMAEMSLDDGKRFHLALRFEQALLREVRWGDASSTTDGLLPLRIVWSEVPSPESMIRTLGTSFTISEGRQATAFDRSLVPLVDHVLSRLGFRMVSNAT